MNVLLLSIAGLGIASYAVGLQQILKGSYKPSVFSRVVWVLLAINSFAGVLASKSTKASILLAAIFLLGNIAVCVASLWKGSREFGRLEYICVGLLVVSGILWVTVDAPLVNLGLSLGAHFIGALPTYRKVWRNPRSESTAFWSLFFFASLLSIAASRGAPVDKIIFPIYFTLFDGSLFALSLRRPLTVRR